MEFMYLVMLYIITKSACQVTGGEGVLGAGGVGN